jgi:hypothetical protein
MKRVIKRRSVIKPVPVGSEIIFSGHGAQTALVVKGNTSPGPDCYRHGNASVS